MNPLRRAPHAFQITKAHPTRACKARQPLRAGVAGFSNPINSIHTTPNRTANPINHPPAPGPPPKPPIPEPSAEEDRVSRKKRNAELVERGRELKNAATQQPGTALQRRFWKDVKVEKTDEGYQIYLDARPLRTPSRQALTVPLSKPHLATAIALEWDLLVSAQQALKQHYIPLTSLASRALDISRADQAEDNSIRNAVVKMVMRYLNTDTLLCWAPAKNTEEPDPASNIAASINASKQAPRALSLRDRQKAVAEPIMHFLTTHVWPGTQLLPALGEDSILPMSQPEHTADVIRGWATGLSAWELAALERGVLASKSVCVASRLLVEWSLGGGGVRIADSSSPSSSSTSQPERQTPDQTDSKDVFTIDDAAEACSIEVRWQTGMWGEVEDTHDVEKEDVRRQLGSVILLVS